MKSPAPGNPPLATLAIAEHDAETRFRIRAERGRGHAERGLKLLRKAAGGTRRI